MGGDCRQHLVQEQTRNERFDPSLGLSSWAGKLGDPRLAYGYGGIQFGITGAARSHANDQQDGPACSNKHESVGIPTKDRYKQGKRWVLSQGLEVLKSGSPRDGPSKKRPIIESNSSLRFARDHGSEWGVRALHHDGYR